MKSGRQSFFVLFFGWVVALQAPNVWAQQSWAFEQVSSAIYQLDQPITQRFDTSRIPDAPTQDQKITQLMVQIMPSSAALIQSYVCVNDTYNCVPIQGGRLYTQVFNEYSAQLPILVVHRVRGWSGTYPPLFIKSQVNLWWE